MAANYIMVELFIRGSEVCLNTFFQTLTGFSDDVVPLLIPVKQGGTQAVRVVLTSSKEDKDLFQVPSKPDSSTVLSMSKRWCLYFGLQLILSNCPPLTWKNKYLQQDVKMRTQDWTSYNHLIKCIHIFSKCFKTLHDIILHAYLGFTKFISPLVFNFVEGASKHGRGTKQALSWLSRGDRFDFHFSETCCGPQLTKWSISIWTSFQSFWTLHDQPFLYSYWPYTMKTYFVQILRLFIQNSYLHSLERWMSSESPWVGSFPMYSISAILWRTLALWTREPTYLEQFPI